MVLGDFQGEAPVDRDAFALEIPADYTLLATVDVGRMESGAQLVEGLAYFAELSGGTYPAGLAPTEMVGGVSRIYQTRAARGVALELDDDLIIKLKMAGAYVNGPRAEGKEPMYYGQTTTAADIDKVLVRWKLDDHQYRVIFGDLRIEDVSPQHLAQLEAQ